MGSIVLQLLPHARARDRSAASFERCRSPLGTAEPTASLRREYVGVERLHPWQTGRCRRQEDKLRGSRRIELEGHWRRRYRARRSVQRVDSGLASTPICRWSPKLHGRLSGEVRTDVSPRTASRETPRSCQSAQATRNSGGICACSCSGRLRRWMPAFVRPNPNVTFRHQIPAH